MPGSPRVQHRKPESSPASAPVLPSNPGMLCRILYDIYFQCCLLPLLRPDESAPGVAENESTLDSGVDEGSLERGSSKGSIVQRF